MSIPSWALSVTLLFNFIEALVLYRRSLTSTDGERLTIAQLQAGAGRSLSTALASPVTARSVGFAQIYGSRGSPKTKATQYQNSAPSHDYSVYSPLKRTPSPLKTPITSSPFRRSSSSPFSSSSSPNFERRFPSSSPLSAYRARNLSSSRSSPFSKLGSVPGLEGEDGEIDVGEESFEVDRALRSLSDNFSQVIGDKSNNPGVAARSGA
ncbi:hypothetical protein IE53DRAFT_380202 [Violaceomyces palustris]|uniref:Uncharacterized protein n=1 Tax=Violaceomyces palustris TaxID=1673888 RepID=A0ACD0NVS1_9BASI|nr:hypothetical protein IE53DRAFT_380202 [Violaceomyces palustris]